LRFLCPIFGQRADKKNKKKYTNKQTHKNGKTRRWVMNKGRMPETDT
jgi:hypothetical protein